MPVIVYKSGTSRYVLYTAHTSRDVPHVVKVVTKSELAVLNRAIALLRSLTDEPHAVDAIPRSGAVTRFVREFLVHDPTGDISCAEAWNFFREVAASGALKPMRKSEFFRRLPAVVEATYDAKKCHSIRRDGRTVRGFKSVTIREHTIPSTVVELEPDDDLAGFRRGVRR